MATDQYHKIFNVEPFGEIYSDDVPSEFVKVLFSTSLTIIIPKIKDNRVLKIYNLKQKLKICELIFPGPIIDVKVNKKRLVVVLNIGQIYIYDLSCVKLIKIIDINKVDQFVGDLSNDDHSLLAIPFLLISNESDIFKNIDATLLMKFDKPKESVHYKGWVLIYDTIELKPKLIFKCHSSELNKIIVSNMIIVTASIKGTIIRAFHLNTLDQELGLFKIQSFRRGRNPAVINCLCLNKDNSILGCGSQSNTIHFFKLVDDPRQTGNNNQQDKDNVQDLESQSDHTEDDDNDNDDDGGLSSKLLEDLNENLANLLISKPQDNNDKDPDDHKDKTFLTRFNKNVIHSSYTKKIIKKLPYKEYFDNLILEPPTRSFTYIKLKTKGHRITMGFIDDLILIVTSNGGYYQYKFLGEKQCTLINKYSLLVD